MRIFGGRQAASLSLPAARLPALGDRWFSPGENLMIRLAAEFRIGDHTPMIPCLMILALLAALIADESLNER